MANEIVERVIIVVLGLRHRMVEAPKAQIMAAIEEDNDDYFIPWLGLGPSQFLGTFQPSLASKSMVYSSTDAPQHCQVLQLPG